MLQFIGYTPDDVYLTTGPLYHSGPGGFMGVAMALGQTIVLQRKFDPEDWLRLLQTYRATSTFAAPTPIRMICNLPAEVKARYDRSSMRIMIANAAPWSFALKQQYLADFPPDSLFEVYGSTELGVNTILRPEDQLRKPGSCGKAAPLVEVRLYDDDGNVVTGTGPERHRRAVRAQPVGVRRLLQAARQVRGGPPRRLPDRRRHRLPRRRGLPLHLRPQEGHDHLRRDEHLPGRDRVRARAAPRRLRGRGVRHPERGVGRERARRRRAPPGQRARRGRRHRARPRSTSPATRCRARSRGPTSCRRPGRARSSSASCGRRSGPTGRSTSDRRVRLGVRDARRPARTSASRRSSTPSAGRRCSIVSDKPQTTRHRIRGVLTRPDAQLVFVDTPGLHKPVTALGRKVNATAIDSVGESDDVDVVAPRPRCHGPVRRRRSMGRRPPRPAAGGGRRQQGRSGDARSRWSPSSAPPPSWARRPTSRSRPAPAKGWTPLVDHLADRLPEGPPFFPDDIVRDVPEEQWVAELVREQLLAVTRDELPYSIATRVTEWEGNRITVEILVERESQKGMVIGKGGHVLKQVGERARAQLPPGTLPRAAGEGRQGLAASRRPRRAAVLRVDERSESAGTNWARSFATVEKICAQFGRWEGRRPDVRGRVRWSRRRR